MVWDYYSEYVKAPNRNGTTIEGVNVVSPSFFSLKKLGQGDIIDKTGENGKNYIEWAHQNGYKVWAMFGNESMIETTSDILNNYELRQKTINNIVNLASNYGLDGINVDFENMYEEDKDVYSRFIIELYPRMREAGLNLSVDVTAPDGGPTWSMCFDRNVIADNCDYIVFMAYDQYGSSSKKAGTTAGYNWVNLGLTKFLKTEEIKPEKIILAMPLYTRIWDEDSSGNATSKVVDMKSVETVLGKAGVEVTRTWNEELKQNYAEYAKDGRTYKMWIEDEASIKAKLSLVLENKLGGIAFWAKDREPDGFWTMVKDHMNNEQ